MPKKPAIAGALQRVVVWRNLIAQGTDYCALWGTRQGWLLKGTAIAVLDAGPVIADYQVFCDAAWQTRRVKIARLLDGQTRTVLFTVLRGRWRATNRALHHLAECVDIDLAITPATNTLPIRRLNLSIGQSAEVTAAWIRFPGLEIEPLPQRYTRLSANRYRYESGSDFRREIVVDDLGLVSSYQNSWERISAF